MGWHYEHIAPNWAWFKVRGGTTVVASACVQQSPPMLGSKLVASMSCSMQSLSEGLTWTHWPVTMRHRCNRMRMRQLVGTRRLAVAAGSRTAPTSRSASWENTEAMTPACRASHMGATFTHAWDCWIGGLHLTCKQLAQHLLGGESCLKFLVARSHWAGTLM